MKILWANQPFPTNTDDNGSIFLAGPTPRSPAVTSWRPRAIRLLEKFGFSGTVYAPEDEHGKWQHSYIQQIDWEETALKLATVIVFWVPRDLETMPAFTTNIEWGVWCKSGKVVLGYPETTPKMKYLKHYATKFRVPTRSDLDGTLRDALKLVGRRSGVAAALDAWNSDFGYRLSDDDDVAKGDGMDEAFRAGWGARGLRKG